MKNKIRMTDREWSANLWARIKTLIGTLTDRIDDIVAASYIPASQKGAAGGVAELDISGHVPSSQLPSYVDDVLEYSSRSAFPLSGEAGKIYVAIDENMPYRWTGSTYVEIASGLALGETSSTAYRGDRGKAAYDHAQAHGSAFASGLYKITTNAEGHVTGASAVVKSDITELGIPGEAPEVDVISNQEIDDIMDAEAEGTFSAYRFAAAATAGVLNVATASTSWTAATLSYTATATGV